MGLVRTNPVELKEPLLNQPLSAPELIESKRASFNNRTAISPQTYPEIFGALISYADGSIITVEYFRRRSAYIDNQALDTGLSLELAAIHSSFDLIHDFEVHLKDQLNIETNSDTNETVITGELVIPPGFKPNPGDVFYLRLNDDQIGAFIVNLVTPLSIHRAAQSLVSFHLYAYLNDTIDAKLRSSVAEELYFSKQTYFSDEATLLTSTSFNQMNQMIASRRAIIRYIFNHYYSKADRTVILPDGIFDAYIVEYLNNVITTADSRSDICQLSMLYVDEFEFTIFNTILTREAAQLAYTGYTLSNYRNAVWDSNISTIDQYRIVRVVADEELSDSARSQLVKFQTTDPAPKTVSYYLSDRFYYALIKSFENGSAIEDIVPLLPEMVTDPRIHPNMEDSFYSLVDDSYHEMSFFDIHNRATGSNNNMHLPELEFMIFDYVINNKIDIEAFTSNILTKFPFAKMTEVDRLFHSSIMLQLIDVAIARLR